MAQHSKKFRLKRIALTIGLFLVLAIAWFAYWNLADRQIEQVQVDDLKVTVRGSVTWDNYCFAGEIIIEKQQPKIKNTFNFNAQLAGYCDISRPWIVIKDVNNDNYKDVLLKDMLLQEEGKDKELATFETYIYNPGTKSFSAE